MKIVVRTKKHNSRTIFGSYQLLRTIGEGEFGKVKLGVKLNTQSAVAIKLIKKKKCI
jgi:serine/threonine protein kinase